MPNMPSQRLTPFAVTALFIIPSGFLLYYILFIYTIYIVSLIAFVASAVFFAIGRSLPFRAVVPSALLYGWWSLTALWSPNPEALYYVGVTGVFWLVGASAIVLKERFWEDATLWLIVLSSAACIISAFYSLYEVGTMIDESKGSMRSTFGTFLAAGISGALYFAITKRSIIAGLVFVASIFVGLQLGSRTFVLIAAPAVLATIFILTRKSEFARLLRYPIILSIALVLGVVANDMLADSGSDIAISGRQTSFSVDESIFSEARSPFEQGADVERRLLIAVGLESFFDNPVVGAGFLSTPEYMLAVYGRAVVAHGFPFFILGETGLIGLVIILIVVRHSLRGYWLAIRQSHPKRSETAMIEMTTFLAILGIGMFQQVYQEFYLFIFLILGSYYNVQYDLNAGARRGSFR